MKRAARVAIASSVVTLYVGLATLSGHLSPMARGPLLDGIGATQPYRWVAPPTSLASTNQEPFVGRFAARFVKNGLQGQVFVTGDNQATVIVASKAFPPRPGDDAVVLTLTPVDPSTLGSLPDGKVAFGNAYHLTAAYRPSGAAVPAPSGPIDLILAYPVTPDLESATHSVFVSADGKTWTALKGTDTPAVQQTEGKPAVLGYAVVGGVLAPGPSTTTAGAGGGANMKVILLSIAVSLLLVGIGLLLRTKGGGDPGAGGEEV